MVAERTRSGRKQGSTQPTTATTKLGEARRLGRPRRRRDRSVEHFRRSHRLHCRQDQTASMQILLGNPYRPKHRRQCRSVCFKPRPRLCYAHSRPLQRIYILLFLILVCSRLCC